MTREELSLPIICYQARLTATEIAVTILTCGAGVSHEEAARRLRLTKHAVECHVSNARRKIRSRFEVDAMVREAMEELRELAEGDPN